MSFLDFFIKKKEPVEEVPYYSWEGLTVPEIADKIAEIFSVCPKTIDESVHPIMTFFNKYKTNQHYVSASNTYEITVQRPFTSIYSYVCDFKIEHILRNMDGITYSLDDGFSYSCTMFLRNYEMSVQMYEILNMLGKEVTSDTRKGSVWVKKVDNFTIILENQKGTCYFMKIVWESNKGEK